MLKGIVLKSIDSFINDKGIVYPLFKNGFPNNNKNVGVHINDCDSEWWDKLSNEDLDLVEGKHYLDELYTPSDELFYKNYDKIQVPIMFYVDDNGNKVFDTEEMTREFESELSKLK